MRRGLEGGKAEWIFERLRKSDNGISEAVGCCEDGYQASRVGDGATRRGIVDDQAECGAEVYLVV
jgi:hypothetical protein